METQPAELDRVFKALGNRRRLAIIRYVQEESDVTIGDIATRIKLSFRATSRHIAILRAAGIVASEQHGLFVHCRLPERPAPLVKKALSLL